MTRPLRVFLCHSSNDKPAVRELYQKLRAESWIQPWLDEEELYPGEDWDLAIEKAVEESDAVLVCLSNNSINKRGYVQKELRFVLDIALEMPEETIFIIPLRLEECIPPRSLREWQYADYFPELQRDRAFQRLLVSLKRRANSLKLKIEPDQPISITNLPRNLETENVIKNIVTSSIDAISKTSPEEQVDVVTWLELPAAKHSAKSEGLITASNKIKLSNGMEFMRIPAGKFLMGSKDDNKLAYNNEKSQHTVDIPYDYWMARFPVTNEQYDIYVNTYVKAKEINHSANKKDHPAVKVGWNTAIKYCRWLNNLLKIELPSDLILRLPTEAEWEKSARGSYGQEYPWGNQFDKNKCNSSESGKGDTTPMYIYSPQGDSPFGCADMAGNVWEWTHSFLKGYPYQNNYERENEILSGSRVLRGGSFNLDDKYLRCAYRSDIVGLLDRSIGFRVCLALPLRWKINNLLQK